MKFQKRDKFDYGISWVTEFSSNIQGGTSVYIGHATCTEIRIFRTLFMSLVKALALKTGMPVDDFTVLYSGLGAGDLWSMEYSDGPTGSTLLYSYTTPASYVLFDVVNNMQAFFSGLAGNDQIQLLNFQYRPANGTGYPFTNLELKQAVLHMAVESELKYQNRTLSLSGSGSTDLVDTNPLCGRAYAGTGSGTDTVSHRRLLGSALYADNTGMITYGGTLSGTFREPPPAKDFINVKSSSKISIAPGEIQTHKLHYRVKMYVNTVMRIFLGGPTAQSRPAEPFGKFAIIGLERALYDQVEEPIVTIAFELNQSFKGLIQENANYKTSTFSDVTA